MGGGGVGSDPSSGYLPIDQHHLTYCICYPIPSIGTGPCSYCTIARESSLSHMLTRAHFYYCCFCTRDPAFRRLVSSLMCSVSVDPSHSLSTAVLALAFCLPLFSTFQLTHCDRLAPRSDPPTSCRGPSPSPAPAEPSRRWRMVQIPTAQPHTCTVHSLISSLSLCSRLHSLQYSLLILIS